MKPIFRSKGSYNSRIIATAPLVYFPLDEVSGSVAKNWGSLGAAANGSYTGVDLHYTPGPKGGGAPYFDGVNDYVNFYSAALAAAFNGDAGSILVWAKVFNPGVWTDGQYRNPLMVGADGTINYLLIRKKSGDNQMSWYRYANSVLQTVVLTTTGPTNWMQLALTWSKNADQVKTFFNGTQSGNTQTGLENFIGNIASNYAVVGAFNSSIAQPWYGYLAHAAVWDRVLTPAEIASLA
jgi:hypothetical protein